MINSKLKKKKMLKRGVFVLFRPNNYLQIKHIRNFRQAAQYKFKIIRKFATKKSDFSTPLPPKDADLSDEKFEHDAFTPPDSVPLKTFRKFKCPKEVLGPNANKAGQYKNPEFFSFHRFSFAILQKAALKLRLKQNSSAVCVENKADNECENACRDECEQLKIVSCSSAEEKCADKNAMLCKAMEKSKKKKKAKKKSPPAIMEAEKMAEAINKNTDAEELRKRIKKAKLKKRQRISKAGQMGECSEECSGSNGSDEKLGQQRKEEQYRIEAARLKQEEERYKKKRKGQKKNKTCGKPKKGKKIKVASKTTNPKPAKIEEKMEKLTVAKDHNNSAVIKTASKKDKMCDNKGKKK